MLFVVRELARHWPEARTTIAALGPGSVVSAFVAGLAGMTIIGLGWRYCLHLLGHSTRPGDALRRYFTGQLGKYVPGGIWPVVGRAEMARRGGASGAVAYGSTLLSLGLTYLAAILTAAAALAMGSGGGQAMSWQPVVALLPIGIVLLHPRVVSLVLTGLRRMSKRPLVLTVPRWGTSVALLAAHVPAWLAISGATWLIANAMSPARPGVGNLVFATTLSWIVGFLIVPVPGGIGVREATFVAAATSLPSPGVAAAVALTARFVFILVDVSGALSTTIWAKRRRIKRTRPGRAGSSAEDGDLLT